jgi:predicted Zn-dependent peptidase
MGRDRYEPLSPLERMHTTTVLDNNLRVTTHEMPSMESVALGLWVGIGGRHEEKQLNGISHFLEHILFKGTSRRSAIQISEAIEGVGGSLNGFTSEEYTCYIAKVPHAHLRLASDVLFDMYLHPAIREEDVQKEKTVIKEEINLYRDTPQHHVLDLFNEVMWTDQPLGRPLVGTATTISALSRESLRGYQRRYYTLRNAVLAAAGRLRHGELLEAVGGSLPKRSGASRGPRCISAADAQRSPGLLLHQKDTEQTHICVGVRGYHREHPDRYALQLLSIAMGENMSSRLFQRIREKHGLAYAIHSSVARYKDTGFFSIYAGVESSKFVKAISLIMKELAMLRKTGLRKIELARGKEYWIGQLSMELEKTTPQMVHIGESLICSGRILTMDEILSKIMCVSLEDVQRVAVDILNDRRLNMAVIGPLREEESQVRENLHFDY